MLNKKKKGARDQMEWATAHFQFCVATLQWCSDRRGVAGASARTTKDLCTSARAGVPGKACHDRPP